MPNLTTSISEQFLFTSLRELNNVITQHSSELTTGCKKTCLQNGKIKLGATFTNKVPMSYKAHILAVIPLSKKCFEDRNER